ncbi:hypothetical protein [Pseudoalteromonas luteoviolacea]|uniref:Uncharacterized protein n=1 Tax=Pseudoalteromonas luteoviolacea DSM 6061 TaxID=1365250 RepID=A0A166XZ53_9GAMM|nr:hypothetical protein [Pseudoalteromonas luteoviolacea]KZN41061.1 hypothetical protein N475_10840 [Pseudoalteromonas luteoviolacea DSM 6061]MBE0389855.1 hypothetical protein [Pseudoalteromonas luteoviolacea DSM 6061]TQF67575.1 hypothetical protein FLM44_20550 [Pseudoalteromonas luteoviolacea]
MKLKINKKSIKSLSSKNVQVPLAQTPQVAGGLPQFPATRIDKGCPWFTHVQARTCPNPY